jgi:outer membrane biosynthesis protein TonB
MIWRQTLAALFLAALMVGGSGCELHKKKPNVPPQAQAPVIMPSTETATTTQPGPPPPASVEPARPLPTPGEVATNIPPEEPAPKPARKPARRTPPPKRTVVENEPQEPAPTPPAQPQPQQGQLTASVSHNDALQQRVDTQQLLDATDNNLRGLTRTLSSDEQVMVAHIRSYMQQSKNATGDGDLERAYNLALKARLLSDELVKK